jgi:tetratricopeptide (TPR) repeat protein
MKTSMPRRLLLPTALALLFACQVVQAQDATLDRARQLITAQGGQGRGAFELLAPLEQQRASEPAYDYLLGLAAIDAGEFTRAVFALERVLAVEPNHPQARAEIARAYFLMGENRTARAEFEAVKASRPPAAVAATIDRFLSALDERQAPFRSGITGFIEGGVGHDSNASAAASGTGLAIPSLPGPGFNPGLRSDTFRTLAAGVSGRYVISSAWTLFGSGNFNQRYNNEVDRFDTGSYGLDAGVSHRRDANEFTLAVQGQAFDVDNTRFRDAMGGVAQWRHSLSDRQQVSLYGQLTRLTYPSINIRNADREVLGVAWANSLQGKLAPVIYAGLYAGREKIRDGAFPELGHRVLGLRGGGQLSFGDSLTAFANLSFEERSYGTPQAIDFRSITSLFPFGRVDKEFGVRVGANYKFASNWVLNPSVAYTDNQSNVSVTSYRRTLFSATLRYEFR